MSTTNDYAMKTFPISFRLSAEKKDALRRAAAEDSRSISSLIDKILSDWLRQHGYIESDS